MENANGVLARCTGYACLSLGETNHAATIYVRRANPDPSSRKTVPRMTAKGRPQPSAMSTDDDVLPKDT